MQNLDELQAWCALWRMPRIGAKRFQKILDAFGEPKAFFCASSTDKKRAGTTISPSDITNAFHDAETDIDWLQKNANAHILTLASPEYPALLRTIADPPPLLFIRGDIEYLNAPQLAIVGSRSPSHEGIDNAHAFAAFLAKQGLVITSGLATGIDGAAHQGALEQGQTIAVMGTGPDRIYPAKHHDLAHQITDAGCVVTELPVGTPVLPQAFPRRNRIISGLTLGTLVIEASLKSGSLITAQTALEQGREVFAIPGSIHNPLARGCNHLIRKGGKLVETANDIFEELQAQLLTFVESQKSDTLEKVNIDLAHHPIDTPPRFADLPASVTDDPEKSALWQALTFEPQPVDLIAKRSGLPAGQVSSILLILELDGHVTKQAGGRYQKKTH
ncbi:DNA-processing protein DprA [Ostreibacterium oceani]|uniref:DNA-protecting protein DprA n=1 Tax=Ostreibacterium oceani TaxID=2654998 RepID=A0A6N7ETL3_9GAMM|nr:DNA-processing protein DprA [Ostreibacterium oceani]MPV86154.1 DNA-protecting protein DprA [Ostreibacterium oceani]